jgi:hypothetical protein
MSEETKKIEQTEQEVKASELSEQELDSVAGGASNDVKGIDIIVKKKPSGNPDKTNPNWKPSY